MKKITLLTIITLLSTSMFYGQKTVSGVTFPKTIKVGDDKKITLNGAGVREKLWIDLYACALYLTTPNKNATDIINSNEACGIKLQIVSGLISSKKMNDAVEEGFKKATNGNIDKLRKRIDAFKSIFAKEEIVKNDIYDIMYIPGKGVMVFKNGKINPIIKGLDFKKALFAIWLGSNPADKDLKNNLLGD